MELVKNTRVFFDPISHTYLLDDDVLLTGVTSLMKKHGLSANYAGIPQERLDAAAKKGTAIHKELEAYDNGETVLVSELIDEYKKLGLRHIASEYLVSDNEMVASSIDKVYATDRDDEVDLADVKTTEKVHKRPLQWQLGIYKVFFEAQNPGVKVRKCLCLHIDKNARKILGLIEIEPVAPEEVEALLAAERNGEIYKDENAEKSAVGVLTESELQEYTVGMEKVAELKDAIKRVEATMKAYEARVLEYMQQNNIEELTSDGGVFKVKKAYERTSIDAAKLRKDYPALADKYGKTSTVAASIAFKANN